MKKIRTAYIILAGLLLFSCQKSNENSINYSGTMRKGTQIINIAVVIGKVSITGTISDCYYLYVNKNQPIKLSAGLVDGDLIMSEKGPNNKAKFIINDFNTSKDTLTGIWVNQNNIADVYTVWLEKKDFRL